MPVYGDLDQVRAMLRPDADTDLGSDAEDRLLAIQIAVSSAIEYKLNRTFGIPAEDTTQTVWAGRSSVLLLPRPARSITSVTVGGDVTGGVITGGSVWADDYWTHDPVDRDTGAIYGLRLLSGGSWGGEDGDGRPVYPVVIVGDFTEADSDADVPDDLNYAVSFLISERFKLESASPAGQVGPDGTVMPIRDAWTDPLVKLVLERYSVGSREIAI